MATFCRIYIAPVRFSNQKGKACSRLVAWIVARLNAIEIVNP
jgi:hypothetical protein